MKEILAQIQRNTKLSDNEQQIVSYILEHLDEISHLSSRELARRCYTTATSITRLIKKLGYENYNDFKYNVITSLKNVPIERTQIDFKENPYLLINKMAKFEKEVIEQTKTMIDLESFQELVNELKNVTYIDIICSDANKEMARYASHYLLTLGKIVSVYYDSDKQFHLSVNVPNDHFVIVLKRTSKNQQLGYFLSLLKERKVRMAIFTGTKEKDISKYCDYIFYTPLDSFSHYLGANEDGTIQLNNMAYHTSIKYIFDLLYVFLYSLENENSHKKMAVYKDIFL